MRSTPFKQVDVFTQQPFRGNPVAVLMQAQGLTDEEMQRIARWTNLSETTFVLPPTQPGADYRLRIFTPGGELPFAGHPTIGTAHALLEAGVVAARDGALVQECGAGLVRLQVEPGEGNGGGAPWIAFELPQPRVTPLDEARIAELEATLGQRVRRGEAAPRLIDVGARWVVAQLDDAHAVLACRPDYARMKGQDLQDHATGVTIFGEHEAGAPARIEVRSFAPACGLEEDPVCGSGNGCVAVFIRDSGQVQRIGAHYVAAQGALLGRAGRVRVDVAPGRIRVAGQAVTCIDGRMAF